MLRPLVASAKRKLALPLYQRPVRHANNGHSPRPLLMQLPPQLPPLPPQGKE